MKANEIRVGNWVNDKFYGDFQIIGLINFNDGNQSAFKSLEDYPQSQTIDLLNPIPLTEEWLIKFGFKNFRFSEKHSTLTLNNLSLLHRVESNQFWFNDIEIKHLHQLQNLYFALTGEELVVHEA